MTTFFTADTHFGDHRTINIWRRPFASVAEMNALLIERWNATVAPNDIVWHLGDVARRAADVPDLLAALNGTKHLIRGNNDPDGTLQSAGWASTADYAELVVDEHRLVLCHYPFRSWNGQHRGALNLHGHSHGRLAPMRRQFDVGVDVHDFAPVTLGDLLAKPDRRERGGSPPVRATSS
ncbi:Calcineurin-like phosphoesterase superfamily protein [Sphingomonas sp. OV641]|uniref:metallophosphoesterase family protein n=1 Tax=Sphingomonas sp. OV641 TaxID=1881068 RepID=UPI0008CB3C1D|nr:metallophosphoesterase family protein [Sphingomonas sp. OV641]SEJ19193.1 Calcineurin-like phosphoesterase superfamily protein [Sphingomonas sp. OV641]